MRDVASFSFDHSSSAPRAARRFVADTLDAWGLDHMAEDVVLLVSELVSNVIHHTDQAPALEISRVGDHLRCAVVDFGGVAPSRRTPTPSERTGRGLQLVDTLAATWGSNTTTGRNEVWFEVPIRRR